MIVAIVCEPPVHVHVSEGAPSMFSLIMFVLMQLQLCMAMDVGNNEANGFVYGCRCCNCDMYIDIMIMRASSGTCCEKCCVHCIPAIAIFSRFGA